MRELSVICLIIFVFLPGCKKDTSFDDKTLLEAINRVSKTGDSSYYIFPESDDYNSLPNQDPANPATAEKVSLGKLLFYETGLAQNPLHDDCYETYSCASCHIPTAGFLPNRIQGIADGAGGYGNNGEFRYVLPKYNHSDLDAQGIRPMSTINSGYSTVTLWSGTFGSSGVNEGTEEFWTELAEVNHTGLIGLEAQNIEAFDLHRMEINERVLDDFGYRVLFDRAFQDFNIEERYTRTTASFAISAYLRSLLSNRAPFQDWLKGDAAALSEDQKEGALLFFGKAGCARCHNESALSAMQFHAIGTSDLYENGGINTDQNDLRNLGRGMFTHRAEDMYRFKVPQLYNLKDYATYFHGSSKRSISQVLDYKMKAESENSNVSNEDLSASFRSFELTEREREQLLDFLENALYDDQLERYVPDEVLSGNCIPHNDQYSRDQIGCE